MQDDHLDQLDYYTLLGVDAAASRDQIRIAFHDFALKFHPDRHSFRPPEDIERVARVYRRGAEAYRILTDAELRRMYDVALSRGELRIDPATAAARANESRPNAAPPIGPKARPFYKKAEEAWKVNDWKTAKLNFQLALQNQPGHPGIEARLAEIEEKLKKK